MNLAEILVVNGIGVAMIVFLRLTMLEIPKPRRAGDVLYSMMTTLAALGCVVEVLTFLIDGRSFPGCRILSYLLNGFLFFGTIMVGCLWCLFVDFRQHLNAKRLYFQARYLLIPVFIVTGLILASFFGTGLLFSISEDNVYQRGPLVWISYAFLFLYYAYSIVLSWNTRRSGLQRQFFPVFYFIIPCVLGTVVQFFFYGLSVGWTTVAIAMLFVHVQVQSMNAYMDALSGVYNRRYMDYILKRSRYGKGLCGIFMDVNDFKGINDRCGHNWGDDAIRTIGDILSEVTPASSVAIRCAGDEFVILMPACEDSQVEAVLANLQKAVDGVNAAKCKPYTISLATGFSRYDPQKDTLEDFLVSLDRQMYLSKECFYRTQSVDRRRS